MIGHNGATRAATVAAVPFSNSATVEPYSSHGPLKKCWQPTTATAPPFTPPGAIINPCTTKTVDFAATDGALNSFFPPGTGPPFRFFGTSAAAPHAAAVGALARQKFPCRTPDEILTAQRSSAVAMGFPVDTVGSGLVDANAMLGAISACGTPPGAPTSPTATAGNAQATVSWTAPVSSGSSAIDAYTVTSSPGGKTCTWTTGPLTCTVTALTNGTSYTFTVVAHNVSGNGPASVPSNAVVPKTVPGAPTGVSASAGDTIAMVSWTAPASNGGATITSYTVTASPGGQTCAWTTGPLTCTVNGLTNGTSYTFTVFAHNAAGNGPASSASSPVTPAAPNLFHPQAPVRVLDSRPGVGNIGGFTTPWAGGTSRKVAVVGGVSGVPADATAVVLNVTVTNTTGSSFLTLWPSGPEPAHRVEPQLDTGGHHPQRGDGEGGRRRPERRQGVGLQPVRQHRCDHRRGRLLPGRCR